MNINERHGRADTERREAAHGAPRSGGRTTVQRAARDTSRTSGGTGVGLADGEVAGLGGARRYPTQGTAALKVEEPPRALGRSTTVESSPAARLKVAPPPPVAVPRAPFVALVLAVVVAGVLGILLINVKTNENAFRIDTLQDRQADLDLRQQQLEKLIAENESPGNLTARARTLGLVEPGPPAFIRLPDGKIIGVPRPANGTPAITSQQGAATRGAATQGAGTQGAGTQGAGTQGAGTQRAADTDRAAGTQGAAGTERAAGTQAAGG